ncbi:MAG: MFS transporter [Planctomycetes bacterium]|nr:MFS transporter [Planctomycetota bacterium]
MTTTPKTSIGRFVNLSVMMFFLFFLWGAWYPMMGSFMGERGLSGDVISWAYSVAPIAAIITPFFMGVFADRFINAEKLQGVLLFLSGIFICLAPQFAKPESSTIFVGLLLAHTLCFMPTLGLSNTVCLKHLANSERDYPIVRVFATLGWIVAGLVVSFGFGEGAEKSEVQFYVAGAAAFFVSVYSFFLPATPPPAKGKKIRVRELYGADTLPYFKKFSFAVFMFASLLACIAMMPYWALGSTFLEKAGIKHPGAFLTMGQVAELFVLALVLPIFIRKFGIKWTMLIGILSWIIRFVLFSTAATSSGTPQMAMLVAAVVLHGFSYDFVFVSGYLYVDRHVREEVRAQAQGLLVVFTQGIGFFLSSQIFVNLVYAPMFEKGDSDAKWKAFWMTPVFYLIVVLVAFAVLFREKKKTLDADKLSDPAAHADS